MYCTFFSWVYLITTTKSVYCPTFPTIAARHALSTPFQHTAYSPLEAGPPPPALTAHLVQALSTSLQQTALTPLEAAPTSPCSRPLPFGPPHTPVCAAYARDTRAAAHDKYMDSERARDRDDLSLIGVSVAECHLRCKKYHVSLHGPDCMKHDAGRYKMCHELYKEAIVIPADNVIYTAL